MKISVGQTFVKKSGSIDKLFVQVRKIDLSNEMVFLKTYTPTDGFLHDFKHNIKKFCDTILNPRNGYSEIKYFKFPTKEKSALTRSRTAS